ncbi:MAG TPA: hypothetical protein VMS54_03570 [Vicinamibacterales bacterium]|nr:hypothetical protein [Vicinamibacterales bacterium]
MKVFVVPVGASRCQLYVELPRDAVVIDTDGASTGWFARKVQQFKQTLAEAEEERLRRERGEPTVARGIGRKIMSKIAEAVAEQRLLWSLRHQTRAELLHPDDMAAPDALAFVKGEFSRDTARHRRWMLIDGLVTAITGPLFFFVPGPNVVSWYFTFRTVGHFLSWRGALRGLNDITWTPEASVPLSGVRAALALGQAERCARLDAIASELGLAHLTGFVERLREQAK